MAFRCLDFFHLAMEASPRNGRMNQSSYPQVCDCRVFCACISLNNLRPSIVIFGTKKRKYIKHISSFTQNCFGRITSIAEIVYLLLKFLNVQFLLEHPVDIIVDVIIQEMSYNNFMKNDVLIWIINYRKIKTYSYSILFFKIYSLW